MSSKKSNLKNQNKFSSENQPKNKNGRKPNVITQLKPCNFSSQDLSTLIKNILFVYDEEKLKDIIEDKQIGIAARIIVRSCYYALKSGRLQEFNSLLDRAGFKLFTLEDDPIDTLVNAIKSLGGSQNISSITAEIVKRLNNENKD